MTTKDYMTLSEMKDEFGNPTFGDYLFSERKCREMSRAEFSKILGITVQSLSDLEKGRRVPSPIRAKKIAEFLGEPVEYWIQLALQDQLSKHGISLSVTVA